MSGLFQPLTAWESDHLPPKVLLALEKQPSRSLYVADSVIRTTSVGLVAITLNIRSIVLLAVVTNDIFTREDQEFLIKHDALPAERIQAIETGGCPHAAIREDISANIGALETLQAKFGCQLLFVESGGDNLAANYSRELADFIIYVIDVAVITFAYAPKSQLIPSVLRVETKSPVRGGPVLPIPTSS